MIKKMIKKLFLWIITKNYDNDPDFEEWLYRQGYK